MASLSESLLVAAKLLAELGTEVARLRIENAPFKGRIKRGVPHGRSLVAIEARFGRQVGANG